MEIIVSVLAVAIAGSCLIALLLADAREARKNKEKNKC